MATYTPIATTTATGSGTITFSSIPSTYTHLVISTSNLISGGPIMKIQFNGDTTDSNYYSSLTWAYSAGLTAANYNVGWLYVYASSIQNQIINIPNYKNTTNYKCWNSQMGDTSVEAVLGAGNWLNNSAITSVSLTLSSGTFSTGRVTLYGIKGA